jgi:acyl-CoA reductase-like NAD-dependent aldehyde dehydrogenase
MLYRLSPHTSIDISSSYPFHNLFNPLISSLITGNALILKSSEQTAFSAQYFVSIAKACLSACGHSPQLVQLVVCSLGHITFIGSRPVAHHVARSASKALTPLTVELGGKDAAIILDDVADLKGVASILLRGTFQSAGQNCVGIERIIALPNVYPKLIEMLRPRIRSLRQGDAATSEESVDIGAAISPAGFDELERLIEDAVNRGARLLAGGKRWTNPAAPKGHYFAPTLLVDVTRDMPVAQQELFGPVCVVMRAESVADAIAITNSTEYGLGCSVFGTRKRDLQKVANEVSVGMVAVNDFAAYYVCGLPFGGVRGSGYGRFGGAEGLRALCNVKSVCLDRWSWGGYGLSTKIPGRLDYVVQKVVEDVGKKEETMAKEKAWQFAKGIVEVGYGMTIWQRMMGVVSLVKNG